MVTKYGEGRGLQNRRGGGGGGAEAGGGYKKFWGSFNIGAFNFSHTDGEAQQFSTAVNEGRFCL